MQEFYTEKQRQDESVSEWGLRLEEIIQRAIDKGHVAESSRNDMLCNKFWQFLRNERLKNATRLYFDKCTEFEDLRRKVRAEEYEMKALDEVRKRDRVKIQSQCVNVDKGESDTTHMLEKLIKRMDILENKIDKTSSESRYPNYTYKPNYGYARQTYRGGNNQNAGRKSTRQQNVKQVEPKVSEKGSQSQRSENLNE